MLYIRTDMNTNIATGHVMRCLAIADAAKEKGENATFILADREAVNLVEKRGYQTIVLHTKWDDMESELPILKEIIQTYSIHQILIDSYQVTHMYLLELTKLVRTIYLDDINAFHYPVNAIICYANYWKKFDYEKNYKDTELYLGSVYAPLRKEFSQIKERRIKDIPENLMLLSGGTDNYHMLKNILSCIATENWGRIDVICGLYNTDYEELQIKYQEKKNIRFHKAVSNIMDYMKQADIAISAGGFTLYELCAVGTPTISYSFADNQLYNVNQFNEDHTIIYAGDIRQKNIAPIISDILEKLYLEKNIREKITKKMQKSVDGKGAVRIAEILIKKNKSKREDTKMGEK